MSAFFQANESNADRVIRVVLGAVLVGLKAGGVVAGTWGWILLVIGAILLLTGLIGWCGLYKLFGFSTRKT
jgi:fatty acid desaturase